MNAMIRLLKNPIIAASLFLAGFVLPAWGAAIWSASLGANTTVNQGMATGILPVTIQCGPGSTKAV